MASTDYTEKQHAEHLAAWRKDRTFPENSVFDAALGDGRLFRKATPEELARVGDAAPAPAEQDGKE